MLRLGVIVIGSIGRLCSLGGGLEGCGGGLKRNRSCLEQGGWCNVGKVGLQVEVITLCLVFMTNR